MNEQEYKNWVAALPSLSATQLNDVSNRLKILSFASTKEFNGKSDFGVRVSEAVCCVLRKIGVECPNPNTLRRSQVYANAKAKFDDLAAFFETISKSKLEQDAVLMTALEQLYNSMIQWGVPISSNTMLQHIHRIPAALNASFPGYAASGLLLRVVKRHESSSQ